ncbi:unnamed protein product [Pieris macdunnoughi]|uniref:Protein takeout n=2 Tax=Pieris macdunnoughi TaxID=345717 RepID=A0A821QV84_9NEOP|nr:unnamed protein product [Pieris macdunnoughi]
MRSSMVIIFSLMSVVLCHEKSYINFGGFICPREEKALGKCLKDALNTYIPQLAAGIPKLDIPSCEPLLIRSLSVKQTTGPLSVTSSFSDVYVRGPSTMRVKSIDIHAKDHEIVARLYIPELRMKGQYTLKGTLLMIPVEANGDFTSKYRDINATVTITLGRSKVFNGLDTLSCEKLDVNFQAGQVTMDLENLFGDDKDLSKTMNNFVNENWQSMSGDFQAPIEEALRDFLKPLADHAFATLYANDIFLSQ